MLSEGVSAGAPLLPALDALLNATEPYARVEKPFRWRGVQLLSGALFERGGDGGDLCVVQRLPQLLRSAVRAKARFAWMHDQADPALAPAMVAADWVMVVSKWAGAEWCRVAPRLADKLLVVNRSFFIGLRMCYLLAC
jgi:hypothetical protein